MRVADLKVQHAHAFTVSLVFPPRHRTAMQNQLYRILETGAVFQAVRTELQAAAEVALGCHQELKGAAG